MTALEMFRSFGITKQAYENFLKPTLLVRVSAGRRLAVLPVTQPGVCVWVHCADYRLQNVARVGRNRALPSLPSQTWPPTLPALQVGLFAPPEELSAAVVVQTLYYYALAHQSDFDVCWCKGSGAPAGGGAAAGSFPALFTCSPSDQIRVRRRSRPVCSSLTNGIRLNGLHSPADLPCAVSELIFEPLIANIKQSGGKVQVGGRVGGAGGPCALAFAPCVLSR
jgi:hypothetical protein